MTSPDRPPSPAARTAGLSAEHRAALIAHLSERLAAVPSAPPVTDQPGNGRRRNGSPGSSVSAASAGSRSAAHRGEDRERPTGRTAIGASGTEGRSGRQRPEGGHPEDAPGDPETVAKQICLRQLTGASKPRAALAEVLRRRGIPDDVATSVLDRFTEVGLIDDEAYAAAYVSTKQRDRSLGTRALRTELRRKGLDDRVITGAVADIDESDERDRAAALIARRIDTAMSAGPVAARRRLVGLLARRGYPSGLAHAVVSEALDGYESAAFETGETVADEAHVGGLGAVELEDIEPGNSQSAADHLDGDEEAGGWDARERSASGRSGRGGARVPSRWPSRSLRSR